MKHISSTLPHPPPPPYSAVPDGTLPTDHFYIINKRTGKHDAYCKSCRRQQNYLHQHPDEALAPTEKTPARPNIFTETDPQRRMQLILQACKVVRESVRRKQQQLREEGLDDEP